MIQALEWLLYTVVMTGLMWVPYVVHAILSNGLLSAMRGEIAEPPAWAQRARAAHNNAVENLVIFAPLVLIADMRLINVASLAMVYFCARIVHYAVYVAGIPYVRTLAFIIGVVIQLMIAYEIVIRLL